MPVASSAQKEPQVSSRLRHLIPKPPSHVSPTGTHYTSQDAQSYLTADIGQYRVASTVASNSTSVEGHFFNPHSPPILNLSPNLSPTQRSSPVYDLRETTRRRSLQGEIK